MSHVSSLSGHALLGFDWTPGYTSAALLIPYMKIQKSKLKSHKTIYVCAALLVTACSSESPNSQSTARYFIFTSAR